MLVTTHLRYFKDTEVEALALAGTGGRRQKRQSREESSQMCVLLPLFHTLAWRGTRMREAKGRGMSAPAPLRTLEMHHLTLHQPG